MKKLLLCFVTMIGVLMSTAQGVKNFDIFSYTPPKNFQLKEIQGTRLQVA